MIVSDTNIIAHLYIESGSSSFARQVFLRDPHWISPILVASGDVLDLAVASGCSAHDAEFVVLAKDLGVPLVTTDQELLEKFPETAINPEAFLAR